MEIPTSHSHGLTNQGQNYLADHSYKKRSTLNVFAYKTEISGSDCLGVAASYSGIASKLGYAENAKNHWHPVSTDVLMNPNSEI